jgi:hypothetical protein
MGLLAAQFNYVDATYLPRHRLLLAYTEAAIKSIATRLLGFA